MTVFLVISTTIGNASAFNILNSNGKTETWGINPVPVDSRTMASDWRSQTNKSIDTWNAAGANISISKQNSNTSNTVMISIGKYLLPNENFAGQERRTSGVTLPDGNIRKTGSEIKLNIKPSLVWSTSTTQNMSAIDVQSVVLHELGHSLGIGHSEKSNAVMQGTVTANKRILTSDDILALKTLYP